MWVVSGTLGVATDGDELAVHPCRSLCRWVRTRRAPSELFACQGCGSQWRPGEAWTPIDADGRIPAAVLRARTAHQRPARGRGWQRGQVNDERFMKASRRTGVPQRGQGRPSWP